MANRWGSKDSGLEAGEKDDMAASEEDKGLHHEHPRHGPATDQPPVKTHSPENRRGHCPYWRFTPDMEAARS